MIFKKSIENLAGRSTDEIREKFENEFKIEKYSDAELEFLSEFCESKLTMSEDNKKRTWVYRNLNDIYKKLGQNQNKGLFSDSAKTTSLSTIDYNIEKFRKKIEGFITEDVKYGKKDSTLSVEKCEKRALNDNFNDYKPNETLAEIMENDNYIAIYDKVKGRSAFRDIYISRKVIAELATYLAIENGKFGPKTNDMLKIQAGKVYAAIENVVKNLSNKGLTTATAPLIKHIACKLADKALVAEVNEKTCRHFYGAQMQKLLKRVPEKFTDVALQLPLKGAKSTSNYNIGCLNDYGDKREFKELSMADKDTCVEKLQSEDLIDVLSGIACLASEIQKMDTFDKGGNGISNFREGAIFAMIVTSLADTKQIKEESANELKEIFAPALTQCLSKLDQEEINDVAKTAADIVEKLGIGYWEVEESVEVSENDELSPVYIGEDAVEADDKNFEELMRDYEDEVKDSVSAVMNIDYSGLNTDGDVVETDDHKAVKSSKISLTTEFKKFRDEITNAIDDVVKKFYNKKALEKKNPERENAVHVKSVLNNNKIRLNKNFSNYSGQSLESLLNELPLEAKNAPAISRVLKKIYEELYSRVLQLMNKASGAEYTTEEKKLIREKYGLTYEDAADIVNGIYSEVFYEDGSIKPDCSASDLLEV